MDSYGFGKNYKYIAVLTEQSCPACNKYFASFLDKNVNNEDLFILSSSSGTGIDISVLIESEHSIFTSSMELNSFNIPIESKFIVLNNDLTAVDTTIYFKAKTLFETVEYLETVVH